MLVEKNKGEDKFLKILGFKKKVFDDKSAYWYVKEFNSKLFNFCQINVQDFQNDGLITVDMYDEEDKSRGFVTAIKKKYTRKKLIKILEALS